MALHRALDTPSAVAVLAVLRWAPRPLTVVEISMRCNYAPNTVGQACALMGQLGAARIERRQPGRTRAYAITDAGREVHERHASNGKGVRR